MPKSFPKYDDDVELSFSLTELILKEYVKAVYSIPENLNIYVSGHRVYIFKGKWVKVPIKQTVQEWAEALYKRFKEYLNRHESEIRCLPFGENKWLRISNLYGEGLLKYHGRKKLKNPNFDAMTLLRCASLANKNLRIRRKTSDRSAVHAAVRAAASRHDLTRQKVCESGHE